MRQNRLFSNFWVIPAILFLIAFFILPLLNNFLSALYQTGSGAGVLDDYIKIFSDTYYLHVLIETLKVSAIVTVLCLLLGYPVSYYMVRFAGKWNVVILFCLVAPLLTSIIMRTFGWQVLLSRTGLLNTIGMSLHVISKPVDLSRQTVAVYIGLIHVLIPFMILSISSVLRGVDTTYEESARILGAGKIRTFLSVTFPLSLDGVATGCILVFVLANGSFVTMLLLGGGKVVTLPLLIYQQFILTQNISFASAIGNVLLIASLLCLLIQIKLVRRKGA